MMIKTAQRVLILVSVLLYATTVCYFIHYRSIITEYNEIPVPIWAIPIEVTNFVKLLQLTAVFVALALLLEFSKLIGGVEDSGKAERKKEE